MSVDSGASSDGTGKGAAATPTVGTIAENGHAKSSGGGGENKDGASPPGPPKSPPPSKSYVARVKSGPVNELTERDFYKKYWIEAGKIGELSERITVIPIA